MASHSGITNLAIVAGAALGAVAALFAGKPKPVPPTRTPPAPSVETIPSPTPAPPAPSASADVWNADEDDPQLSDASVDPRTAELECARGNSRMCLMAATADLDGGRTRMFQNLAVSQWNQACTARDPEACFELAKLHERGIGVPVSGANAKALRDRARELCQQKSSAFCDTLQKQSP